MILCLYSSNKELSYIFKVLFKQVKIGLFSVFFVQRCNQPKEKGKCVCVCVCDVHHGASPKRKPGAEIN